MNEVVRVDLKEATTFSQLTIGITAVAMSRPKDS
jgi:hypothetical protein